MTTHTTGEPYGSPGQYGSYGQQPQSFGPPQPYDAYGTYGTYDDQPTMALRPVPAQGSFGPADPSYAPPPVEQLPSPRRPSDPPTSPPPSTEAEATGRNGLIMALGSLASRALGFVRSAVIAAAIGTGGLAGTYNVGNTLPNIVYIMLIGGALGSVFVPELVRAAQTHRDGGVAYTDRLLTLCTVALVLLTVGAVFAAPYIVSLYAPRYDGAQRALTVAFARYCLPQIMFYGLFTLLGQVLNARGKFGAMMWTPVLNNVVVIAVFGLYIGIGGHATSPEGMTSGQTLLLGLGSTLGIVVQALALVPSLRAAKFRWHPRFDWRGAGLGQPLRSATWALLLVVVTQLSFAVITALTTGADNLGRLAGLDGVGNAAYTNAYQLFVVPQGVITISLVTAVLPRMSRAATEGKLSKIGTDLSQVLKSSAGMIIPATVLFIVLAQQIASIAYDWRNHGGVGIAVIAEALVAFAIGLPAFCAQYALARGFYAMGDARTPFWLAVITSGANVVLSLAAYSMLGPRWIVVGMAAAQSVACVISVVVTGRALSRRLTAAPAAPAASPDQTMMLRSVNAPPLRSGLDGRRVFGLHLGLLLACLPGALAGHWLAGSTDSLLGGGMIGHVGGLGVGSVAVLASLFLLARVFGAGAAVAPLARKLRIPYPAPVETGGKHRR